MWEEAIIGHNRSRTRPKLPKQKYKVANVKDEDSFKSNVLYLCHNIIFLQIAVFLRLWGCVKATYAPAL